MHKIESDISKWTVESNGDFKTAEGFILSEKQRKDLCKFNSVPESVINIDKKFSTRTTLDVLRAAQAAPAFIVEDGKILSVLDNRSKFVSDQEFDSMLEGVNLKYFDFDVVTNGASKKYVYTLSETESDAVFGDVYKRRVVIERLPQGGVSFNGSLLRLACTNGMLIPDAQFRKAFRNNVSADNINVLTDYMLSLSVEDYLKNLFTKDGEPLEASVADYFGMRTTLKKFIEEDDAEVFYPEEPIVNFYQSQGTDVKSLSRTAQSNMRSGVSYYDCFNILTNAIKLAEKLTLDEEIEVARWVKPSKILEIKNIKTYTGAPSFDKGLLKALRGDTKKVISA